MNKNQAMLLKKRLSESEARNKVLEEMLLRIIEECEEQFGEAGDETALADLLEEARELFPDTAGPLPGSIEYEINKAITKRSRSRLKR